MLRLGLMFWRNLSPMTADEVGGGGGVVVNERWVGPEGAEPSEEEPSDDCT
jgi:hypothetical protein